MSTGTAWCTAHSTLAKIVSDTLHERKGLNHMAMGLCG
jgi:hypothetical protein